MEEQCDRLVVKLTGATYQAPTGLPAALAGEYEQRLAAFLPEHPFLREGNSVFASFLFARAVRGTPQAAEVEVFLSSKEYRPSRLFADFYFLDIPPTTAGVPAPVPPQHVGLLYDSLLAGESDRTAVRMTIEGDLDEDNPSSGSTLLDGEFETVDLTTADANEPRLSSRTFQTAVTEADALRFGRYVRDATIIAPCAVELGAGGDEFEIGPAVSIRARTIRIYASRIVAGGRTTSRWLGEPQDNSVVLEADRLESTVTERPIAHVALSVSWPGAESFPWSAHASEPGAGLGDDPRIRYAYRRFRRIVMTLRSHSKGSLARVRQKIEHARVLQGAVGTAMLRRLLEDAILVLQGNFYHLNPTTADALVGVSWMELRRGHSSDRLREYLSRFVRENREVFPERPA